jgi:uncharacterized protein YdeI (YjbR/CyaY-like superfamily)
MTPTFFKTPSDFRKWLAKNHTNTTELLVGFRKKGSGKPSITWPESVEEALCYGWIDGVRKRVDDDSYTIRFSPRKQTSTWSAINIKLVQKLIAEKRMRPSGLAAFKARKATKSVIYSYENRPQSLSPEFEKAFKKNKTALAYFEAQAPWYRRTSIYWVMSAKKEETRLRRLLTLVDDCENHRPIGPLKAKSKSR